MKYLFAVVLPLLGSGCSIPQNGPDTKTPQSQTASSVRENGSAEKPSNMSVDVETYRFKPIGSYVPAPAFPVARAVGILELDGNCITLRRTSEYRLKLVFYEETVRADQTGIVIDGHSIPYGQKVEVGGTGSIDPMVDYADGGCQYDGAWLVAPNSMRPTE